MIFLDLPIVFSDDFGKDNVPVPTVKKTRNRHGIDLDPTLIGKDRERRACAPVNCKFQFLGEFGYDFGILICFHFLDII